MTRSSFTFADICAGIGGFRLALEEIGGKCKYSCEIDKECEKTYFKNYNEMFDTYDVHSIDEELFPDVDIICAGFPCQPFSIAGKKRGFLDYRGMVFFKLLAIIKKKQPKVVFLENVPNLVRIDGGNTFTTILNDLSLSGYNVFFDILDSCNFGVPQSRKRVYIVAIRKDSSTKPFTFTKKRTAKKPFRTFIETGDNSIPISEKWHRYIDLYSGKITLEDLNFEVPRTRRKLERIDPDANLQDCVFQIRSSGIRALSIDKPLPTLAVSISGGGAMIPVYGGERRHLSLIELKRMMGFLDGFAFPVSRTNAIKQLANAVCPPVIASIAADFMDYLFDN